MDNFDFDDWDSDRNYLFWMIDYFCLSHDDLKKVIKVVELMTEEYHDPNSIKFQKRWRNGGSNG